MKYLTLMLAVVCVTASVAAASQKEGAIEKIEIATGDLVRAVPGCNVVDWKFIFARSGPNTFGDRLMRYKTPEDIIEDSKAQTELFGGYEKSAEVNQLIAERAEEKVDFMRHDLVVVWRSIPGGSGEFCEEIRGDTAHFWAKSFGANNFSLRSSFDFYTIPKGLKVQGKP